MQPTPQPKWELREGNVPDGLGDEFKEWRSQSPVLISAQTGAGKNYFIMNRLIPYANSIGQPVFLFTNRIALNIQQKHDVLHTLRYPDIFSNRELEQINSFGSNYILNYQSASGINQQFSPLLSGLFSHGFAVFDEAHFFLSDSLFNADTEQILQNLIFALSQYVRIYLTATPDDVLDIINFYEMNNTASATLTYYDLHKINNRSYRERALYVYQFPRDYSNYNVTFFTDFHELYDELGKANKNDKWLCFINDISQQEQIAEYLRNIHKISVICFDRTKKRNDKIWNSLMEGQLPQNVLLTTIALDNGVNMSDPALHHIVIDFADKVSLLQMVGRKRRSADEQVNLYIRAPNQEFIERRLRFIREMTAFLLEYMTNPTGFLQKHWYDFHQKYRNLFYINNGNNLVPNNLAYRQLNILENFYAGLLYKMQSVPNAVQANEVYPKMVLEWMGLPQNIQWTASAKIDQAVSNLCVLLENYIENGIPEEKHKEFFDQFANLADTILNGSEPFRKDVRSGPSIMSKFLDEMKDKLGAVYKIEGRGTWNVSKS